MADRASTYPLQRLCDAGVVLLDCEHNTPKPASSGYPYIAIPDIVDGRLDLSAVRLISEEDLQRWTRKTRPQSGDIIVTRRGRVGDSAVVPPGLRCAIGQNLVILRSNGQQVAQEYLRWALRGPLYEQQVQKYLNVGAVFDSLNCADIPKFEIPVPSLPEQRAIAHILGTLDDKIELNQRMNETLEAIAKALFRSWFVDFDPVRAKAEGREPVGMDAETAAMFPSEFVDSAQGKVPKGWQVKYLPDLFDINPPRPLTKGEAAPYLEMSNMPTSSARVVEWTEREVGSGMRFINGDVLVARITPCLENGKTAFVDFLLPGQTGWGSTEYIVFHSKPPIPSEYMYFLARSDAFRTYAIQNMTGTSGRQRVPASCFDSYLVVEPSVAILHAFGALAKDMLEMMKAHDEEAATLGQIRDALLPKLLSGEIRVQDAEQAISAAM